VLYNETEESEESEESSPLVGSARRTRGKVRGTNKTRILVAFEANYRAVLRLVVRRSD
jgi:hypothetical protein